MNSGNPLLVFDLDGTIVETSGDLVGALNHVMGVEKLPAVPLADARHMVGHGARKLIERGLSAHGKTVSAPRMEELFQEFLSYYSENIAVHSSIFPGVTKALDQLEQAGFHFAVCTNKIEAPSKKLLAILGIADRFRAICGQDTFTMCKPDPRALLSTIALAKGDPANTIMIGDSRTDIDTAKAAQIPVVAVDFGYTDLHVSHFNPDVVISHFDELQAAIARIRGPAGHFNRKDKSQADA
ncbi:MAG: phosphoglycolate phosphatase [Hyphomicrobiales bacterium]|nr:phosphoglycolate phosphatase [Hyphomicrobiales bacterium]MDE2113730.1 phosphoglycolate phosphatase [Hyphomicrobiales bacterium]